MYVCMFKMYFKPDLAPCDFHFFPRLNRDIKGIHFTLDDELKDIVRSWVKERPPAFFFDGMRKLVHCWEKCVAVNGDYMEK